MNPLAGWQARRAERRRVAELQAACDHDWQFIEIFEGKTYLTFRAIMLPDGSSTVRKYQCRKCGKTKLETNTDQV